MYFCGHRFTKLDFYKLDKLSVQQCLLSNEGATKIKNIMDRVINDNLSY